MNGGVRRASHVHVCVVGSGSSSLFRELSELTTHLYVYVCLCVCEEVRWCDGEGDTVLLALGR